MKKPITGVIALLAGVLAAHSQGKVGFGNYASGYGSYIYISLESTDLGGSGTGPPPTTANYASETASGNDWTVALYGAAGASQPVSAMAQLYDSEGSPVVAPLANGVSDALAGTWYSGDSAVVPGAEAGSAATVQLYAWYNAGGTITNFAAALAAGVPAGFSATANLSSLGGQKPGAPPGFPAVLPLSLLGSFSLTFIPSGIVPTLTWTIGGPITYGDAITAEQLNATANVPGTFAYSEAIGTVLDAGTNTLSVVFTPTDTISYTSATNYVNLIVLPAPLTVTATPQSKMYGQTVVFGGGSAQFIANGLQNGDTIGSVTLGVNNNGGATTAPVSGSPYTITPNAATSGTFTPGNYAITYGTGNLTVSPAPLTIASGITANNKIYNGTTTATLSSNSAVLLGVLIGDNVILNTNGYSANFAIAGVGNSIAVTVSGLTLSGTSAGNYVLTQPLGLTANITTAPVSISSGITANNKVYNGTTTATLSSNNVVLVGVVASDTLSLHTNDYVANFASAGAGNGIGVSVSSLTLSGASAGNYTLTQPASLTANITAASVTIGSGLTANNKIYNRTTSATLTSNNVALVGVVTSDTVSLNTNGYLANFASANVGNGIAVTVSALTLSGASAGNYTLTQPVGLTANITAAQVTIGSGLTANNKVYNGTTTATLTSNNVALVGVVTSDTVSLNTNGYLANFASANAGNGIAVTVSGLTLSGASAGNYALTQPMGLAANIATASVSISSGITANNKVYNGTTAATLASNNVVLVGVVTGDTVSLNTNGYAANFASAGVGNGIVVTVSGLMLSGTSAANYTLTQPASLTANITAASVTIGSGVTANNKVYNRTTTATLTSNNVALVGVVTGDTVILNTNGYIANFASANVGNGVAVTVSGLTLGGASAGDYTLTEPASLTANITAAPVTITSGLTANNKVYNGTTIATLTSNNVVLSGIVTGDTVILNTNGYIASFASANVGNGVAVTVTGLTLSGGSAGNYTLTQPLGLTANIILPSLQIVASLPNVVISWTTTATDYVLNETASLEPPVAWARVTNSVTVSGTTSTVTINAGTGGDQYFELIGPP
jgi:endonuclease YncB( thermonuclease family)